MLCPRETAAILSKIVETALLRIRAEGWAGDAARCAVEADHVHNLSGLLADYSPERLAYYWNIERPAYVAQSEGRDLATWEPLWRELSPYVEAVALSTPSQPEFS